MIPKDINEEHLYREYPGVLEELLKDRTTGENIIWATSDYVHFSSNHSAEAAITPEAVTGRFAGVISPRVLKGAEQQTLRVRGKAEVFTPSWLCNYQNSLVDNAWFQQSGIFNVPTERGWQTNPALIPFEPEGTKTWKHYVDEPRIEIACGEAPYLASRYDTTTGDSIAIENRIGLLDRKMRVVKENTSTDKEWLEWAERAFQSVYGYEFHGDSLLLARENLFASYLDYAFDALERVPSSRDLMRIALIISWNLWQMDAFTGTVPFRTALPPSHQTELFSLKDDQAGPPCLVRDWRADETVPFVTVFTGDF